MKDEDIDWMCYHIIAREPVMPIEKIAAASGLDAATIESSLARLDKALLVERKNDTVRVLSFGESLIKTQVKYSDDFPIVFEDGVIKEKKRSP